jgi:tetratricopeptide (TPR) repeat protein
MLLLVLFALPVWFVNRSYRKYALFGLLVFAIGFLPVSQIIPINTLMNDRYLYFPMLGFSCYALMLCREVVGRVSLNYRAAISVAVGLFVVLSSLTWQRVAVWSDSVSVWEDAVAKQPGVDHAWKMLGNSYGKVGNNQKAIESYEKTLQLNPGNIDALYDLGVLYDENKDYDKAIHYYFKVLAVSPGHMSSIYNLGLLYTIKHQYVTAKNILNRALVVNPESLDVLLLMAANCYFLQDFSSAAHFYQRARSLDRGSYELAGYQSLMALRSHRESDSRQFWDEAIALGGSAAEIYLDWARLDAVGENRLLALESLEKAIASGVDNLDALYKDPDFESLRQNSRFMELLGKTPESL